MREKYRQKLLGKAIERHKRWMIKNHVKGEITNELIKKLSHA
jgi:hypothetical protein